MIQKHMNRIDKAFSDFNYYLELKAVQAALKLSKSAKNKDKDCCFICAKGDWFWFIDDNTNVKPSAHNSWQCAFDKYGYSFMVRSIHVICRNGKIIKNLRGR